MKRFALYFINWNDSFYFPFIKKHYGSFCEKIVMYDNHSTDNSQQLAKDLGFEVRTFGYNQLNDQSYLDVKNHCWKEDRGKGIDYVIVCDADEFVKIPKAWNTPFSGFVGTPTAPIVNGYNMISDALPLFDIFEISTGAPSENYSKQAIFMPDFVDEINYVHGCHKNNKTGHITTEGSFCELYHFRQIGGVDRMIQKHSEYRARMSKFNLKHKMGFHYHQSDEQKIEEWNKLQSEATTLW